jgi:thioredoxin-like negative regulator of GroEL
MIIKTLILSGGAVLAALNAAAAVASGPAEPHAYASEAITSGQYAAAEKILQPASFADAGDPARLINIATVYAQTSRTAEARAALERVQSLPDEALTLANGASYSSRAIAGAMLKRLP